MRVPPQGPAQLQDAAVLAFVATDFVGNSPPSEEPGGWTSPVMQSGGRRVVPEGPVEMSRDLGPGAPVKRVFLLLRCVSHPCFTTMSNEVGFYMQLIVSEFL